MFRLLKEEEALKLFSLHAKGLEESKVNEECDDTYFNMVYDDIERNVVMDLASSSNSASDNLPSPEKRF